MHKIVYYDVPKFCQFTLNRSTSVNDLTIGNKHGQISCFRSALAVSILAQFNNGKNDYWPEVADYRAMGGLSIS